MSMTFTPERIFDTTIQVERNGAVFYGKAAALAPKRALRRKLLELAETEHVHMQTFARLKDLILGSEKNAKHFDPDNRIAQYLRVFAKRGIFNMTLDAAQALSTETGMPDILHFAMERERDSIMFYVGIREAIPKRFGQDKIAAIIYEEMSHLVLLEQELGKLKPFPA